MWLNLIIWILSQEKRNTTRNNNDIIKYNIKIYVHGYPNLQIKHCPTFELTYLKTNLSISCFVALSFWMMRIFYPEMLVPKNLENVLHVAPHIEYWIHLVNFIFLLLELIWEKHRFQVNHDKQYTIFFVIFLAYSFILLLFNLVYEKNVYPFLDKLTFITGVLMGIIVVGLFVIFDFIFSYVIQEYWGY